MSDSNNPIYYSTHPWNLARSIASAALDYTGETHDTIDDQDGLTVAETYTYLVDTYETYEQSNDVEIWPFESLFDLVEMVEEHVGFDTDGRPLDNLASAISTRITESSKYEFRAEDPDSGSADPDDEEPQLPLDTFDEAVCDIAYNLYRYFVTYDEGVAFRDIQAKYDHQFPKRSVTQLTVANTKGTTEEDRIRNIAEWVDTWFGSDQEVQEVDRFAHKPMGQPVRNY